MLVGNRGALGQERTGAGGFGAGGLMAGGFVVERLHGIIERGLQLGALGNQAGVVVPERPRAGSQGGNQREAHQDGCRGQAEHQSPPFRTMPGT